jgi:TonB family protein
VDTSEWAVPFLIPHPKDYSEQSQFRLLHSESQQTLVVEIRRLANNYFASHKMRCMEIEKVPYLTTLDTSETIRIEKDKYYAEICFSKKKVAIVRGYYEVNDQNLVFFRYAPNASFNNHEELCNSLEVMFRSLRIVGAKTIDEKAGLPLSHIADINARRQFVLTSLLNRNRLHEHHAPATQLPPTWPWLQYAKPSSMDTLAFDKTLLTPYLNAFTFQRVAKELDAIQSKMIESEEAIASYLGPNIYIHEAYYVMATSKAISSISDQISLSLGKKINLQNGLIRMKHTDDLILMKGETPTQSYLVTAIHNKNRWHFEPALIGNLSEEESKTTYRTGFKARENNQMADRKFVLNIPPITTDQSFGFGFVNSYRKTSSSYIASIPKRFVLRTSASSPKPLFFPDVKTTTYDVVYEIISPMHGMPPFMSHVFEGSTKIANKYWRYSIHYADEEKLLAARVNQYQKVSVDDPFRRAYVTPIYITDYDRNGKNETWYALISDGQIKEILGFQNTSKGLVPLQVSDSFKSKMKLESSIQEVLEISKYTQDPFQRNPTEQTGLSDELTRYRGDELGTIEHYSTMEEIPYHGLDGEEIPIPAEESRSEVVLSFAQEMPVYPGGQAQMDIDIFKNIVYPTAEKEAGIGGKVYIQCIIELDGSVSNVRTVRGVSGGPNLSRAAENAVKSLKKFTPAKQNNKPIRLQMTIPVIFKLQ